MLNRTTIEWCLNPNGSPGYTWNPLSGCMHGCLYCYAYDITVRWKRSFTPHLHRDRLDDLNKYAMTPKPKTIYVGSMGDIFGFWNINLGWLNKVDEKIMQNNAFRRKKNYPLNTFVFLTKNPAGYRHLCTIIPNAWYGITLENFGYDERNTRRAMVFNEIISSMNIQNTFISLEPILEGKTFNDDVIKLLIEVKWIIMGALNIKGRVQPPQGDQNMGGIILKVIRMNLKLFVKDSIQRMKGKYWRESAEEMVKALRYIPWADEPITVENYFDLKKKISNY